MSHDGLRGMSIAYNRLNLPGSIAAANDSVQYGYLADGQKREKRFNDTVTQQYRGAMVYDGSGTPDHVLHPEGMAVHTGNGQWEWRYHLTDHLGNTRAVLDENGAILQQTDYHPFGAAYTLDNTDKNKYLYGGKELQDETLGGTQLNLYDFGARFYDSQHLLRFTSPDPLAEMYYNVSPYTYCLNNPVNAIDPSGELVIFINGMHSGDGGTKDYWNGFDASVMQHLNDYNPIYIDGSNGGVWGLPHNVSASKRVTMGAIEGARDAAKIFKLVSDTNGNIKETIKIITHSMGAAYAKGYVFALMMYLKENNIPLDLIEFEADFAPYQPTKQQAVEGIETIQFTNRHDNVASNPWLTSPYGYIKGAKVVTDYDENKGHDTSDFWDKVRSLPAGKYKVVDGKIVPQ